ncbi:hypothetical protein G114_01164 [Aeromonas diversa CDC 2478-85]|uniref:Uncharacterized protein n=1 Tax=Aeromonas diversa CDC 2478-85 TaxID=1268237 RepID=N9VQ09_9GAMM|nr:hypothetical protein [Aeromonas diversa]ENY73623.1 hypothetical protein G114_01164 [Aeromonas diversa CDC 2478-85]
MASPLMRLRRIGVSPALRAVASDFLLAQEVTKKAFPRQSDRCAVALDSVARSDGPPHTAYPYAACGCAIILDAAPDLAPSPRRIEGGANTLPLRKLG